MLPTAVFPKYISRTGPRKQDGGEIFSQQIYGMLIFTSYHGQWHSLWVNADWFDVNIYEHSTLVTF